MPGNLTAATVSPTATVFPQSLSTLFTLSANFPLLNTMYHDGTIENSEIKDGVNPPQAFRVWTLSKRITTAQLATLRTFWETVEGGLNPFYFYDPYQPLSGHAIGSNYDATGVSSQGRVKVFFRGNWAQQTELGRHVVPNLVLVEVA
jgi:hypothetical protein